jgi:mxaJ protein
MCFPYLDRGWKAALAFTAALTIQAGMIRADERMLRVCADPNNLPFSNDKGEGFENKIVEMLALELNARPVYTWRAQRRGFLRETLKAGACDLVPGYSTHVHGVRTTRPYYRSAYVFVSRAGRAGVASFDDPELKLLRIGVQLIGDEGVNTPPVASLIKRGIVANLRGYHLYADYRQPNPTARIIDAVANGEVDVAVAWGPLAGYFAARSVTALRLAVVQPLADGPKSPMAFDVSMAVRKDDAVLAAEISAVLERRRSDVDAILASYGVPRVEAVPPAHEAAQ